MKGNCILSGAAAALGALASTAAIAGPGDILWRSPSTPTAASGGRVLVSPAGDVYWQTPAWWEGEGYGLRAFRPDGSPMYHIPEGGSDYVAFDAAGKLYALTFDPDPVVVARDAGTGDFRWRTVIPAGNGFLGGVDIGPDGNIYVCSDGGYGGSGGGSLSSLTPEGDIRWSHDGFGNSGGSPDSRMAFINDLVVKVEDSTPAPVGPFQTSGGMYAVEMETGAFAWWLPQGVSATLWRTPVADQEPGRIYTSKLGAVWMVSPTGELLDIGGRGDGLVLDSEGSLYSAARGPLKMDQDLNIVWEHTSGVPAGWASTPALSPDESLVAVGYSVAPFMSEDTGHVLIVRASDGATVATVPFPNSTGLSSNVQGLAFSRDGSVLYAGIVYGDNWPGTTSYYRSELVAIEVANPGLDLAFTEAPPLVPAAGAPFEVEIAAADGATLDTSSPTLWFDAGAGWQSRPLDSAGAGRFRGVIPAAECPAPVRYYVAAADTTGAVYTEPRFAPRYFVDALSGEGVERATLVEESFEGGLPSGWSAGGLWHITGACSPGSSCDGSTSFAYFGHDDTCIYRGPDPYQPEEGSLHLPPVDLTTVPPGGRAELTFCYTLEAEMYFDTHDVRVNGVVAGRLIPSASWTTGAVNLSPYAGQVIDLEFVMRLHNPAWQPYRGLQIDSVRIEADTVVCDGCSADLTGDGALDFFDFLAFQNLFAAGDLRADFTGDGVLDFFDFLGFQNEFAASCP